MKLIGQPEVNNVLNQYLSNTSIGTTVTLNNNGS